jgi:hypothetical protein
MRVVHTSLLAVALYVPAIAQQYSAPITPGLSTVLPPKNNCTGKTGLACVMPNLYGQYGGIVLPNSTFPAIFNSGFQKAFSTFNDALATQLTLLPIASPASGFTYAFDQSTGVYQRTAESFGPVLTERAETIGRHKIFVGATFQRFRFNKIDGYPLHNWPAIFVHAAGTGPGGAVEPYETQLISTVNSLDLKVNQFTIFGTFGLTDHMDISVAIPFEQIGMNAAAYATIQRTVDTEPTIANGVLRPCCSSGPPYANFFDPANPATSLTNTYGNNQYAPGVLGNSAKANNLYFNPSRNHAAGIGDVTFRFKDNVYRSERLSFALLVDFRARTGDSMNFLGTGAYGWKPFAALSVRTGPFTPHLNGGYQWNGQSVLGGNIFTGTKANLPGFAFFSAGTDIGVTRKLTLAADYIGQELINAPRVTLASYTSQAPLVSSGQIGTFPTVNPVANRTYNQSNVAIGGKLSLVDGFIFSSNLLIAVNDGGLRDRLVPLIGFSYTF